MEERYIVLKRWEKSYPDFIVLQKEDKVIINYSVKDSTPGWDNWVWCISANGQTGWVPAQILKITNTIDGDNDEKEALVLEDYSANELTVEEDEILIGTRILNGWIWCCEQNNNMEGWVPLDNVEIL